MAAPPVTCRRKTPAYATSTPAYSFWQRRNLGTRTTSNRRPRRTPILLTPTCHKPRIPTIAHLQLRTIAQFQRIGTLTAQESTDNRGNGSQASEQLRPLPNLVRPVTPTTSCEAPLLFDFTDSCSCWPGPAPRTHQTRHGWRPPTKPKLQRQHTTKAWCNIDQVHRMQDGTHNHHLANPAEHTHRTPAQCPAHPLTSTYTTQADTPTHGQCRRRVQRLCPGHPRQHTPAYARHPHTPQRRVQSPAVDRRVSRSPPPAPSIRHTSALMQHHHHDTPSQS